MNRYLKWWLFNGATAILLYFAMQGSAGCANVMKFYIVISALCYFVAYCSLCNNPKQFNDHLEAMQESAYSVKFNTIVSLLFTGVYVYSGWFFIGFLALITVFTEKCILEAKEKYDEKMRDKIMENL